jgi:heme exporter protein CcmD
MNDDPWKWIGHITASYAVTTLVLALLITWLLWDGRRQQRRIDELESRGIRRHGRTGVDAQS